MYMCVQHATNPPPLPSLIPGRIQLCCSPAILPNCCCTAALPNNSPAAATSRY
jgi:hypothetical protein